MTREEIESHIDKYVNDGIGLPEFILDCYDDVYGSLMIQNTAYSPNARQDLIDLVLIRQSPLAKVMRELDNED